MYFIFSTDTYETKMMSKLSPLKLLETFTKGNLLVDIRAPWLKSGNDSYDNIVDYLEQIVDLVHSEVGLTVYRWGERGLINGVSLLGNDSKELGENKALSPEISTHVVHINLQRKIIQTFLHFMRGPLTTSNLTFIYYKYFFAINKNVGMSLQI